MDKKHTFILKQTTKERRRYSSRRPACVTSALLLLVVRLQTKSPCRCKVLGKFPLVGSSSHESLELMSLKVPMDSGRTLEMFYPPWLKKFTHQLLLLFSNWGYASFIHREVYHCYGPWCIPSSPDGTALHCIPATGLARADSYGWSILPFWSLFRLWTAWPLEQPSRTCSRVDRGEFCKGEVLSSLSSWFGFVWVVFVRPVDFEQYIALEIIKSCTLFCFSSGRMHLCFSSYFPLVYWWNKKQLSAFDILTRLSSLTEAKQFCGLKQSCCLALTCKWEIDKMSASGLSPQVQRCCTAFSFSARWLQTASPIPLPIKCCVRSHAMLDRSAMLSAFQL